jgi:hypothetical protein
MKTISLLNPEEIYTKTKIPLSISKKIIDLSKEFKK